MSELLEPTILELEQSLLAPEVRQSADRLSRLLSDDFMEIGASGTVYRKSDVLAVLPQQQPADWSLTEFEVRHIADGVVLATYRSVRRGEAGRADAAARRSSIWRQRDGRWELVFHQGTPASCPDRQ